MREKRKDSTQRNIHTTIFNNIQAFRAVWFVPFVLVVLPYPAVQLANMLNQLYSGIQWWLACPPGPPITDSNRLLKKFTHAGAGESIASGLCARSSCFSPGRPQYRSRGQRCRIKNSLQVLGKSLGEKKCMCGCLICACKCFIARESLNARAWFMAVFYAHTGAFLALVTPTLCPPNK